jgi:branched-chain amino acid transport system substrate-binding protein
MHALKRAAAVIAVAAGVMFVTPTSTNPMVTDRGLWNAFRACGRDDQQGSIAATFVLDRFQRKKVAIVDDNSTAGKGLADEMRKGYAAGGGEPARSESINPGEKDYSALVQKLKASGDGVSNSEFASIGGRGGAGALMTSFPDPSQRAQARGVVAELAALNIPREAVTFHAYGATQIVAEAIAKSGKPDPKAAAAYLRSGATVPTILGPIAYDKNEDIRQPGFVVFEWKAIDGTLVPAEPKP